MPSFAVADEAGKFVDLPVLTLEFVTDHFTFTARGRALGLVYLIAGQLSLEAARAYGQGLGQELSLTDCVHETGVNPDTGAADQEVEYETYTYEVPEPLRPQIKAYLQETLDKM
jgi:hypothetical protein